MSIHNADIADAFDEIGDLLSLQGENPFRIRAYRRAARVVRGLPQQLAELQGVSGYDAIPGIGRDLSGKIAELVKSGRIKALEKLRREVPPGARDLLGLPGMGPARVRTLMNSLQVKDREDLKRALASGQLALVRGFGEMLQSRLRAALGVTGEVTGASGARGPARG
jgi:DNA polymerase (family 10)